MSDMDWNKHLLDKIETQAATIAEQAEEMLRHVLAATRRAIVRAAAEIGRAAQ